jgi:hypothetical protein
MLSRMAPRKKSASAPPATASAADAIAINRAPVLTLWAAVVAERLGYDADEAATLGRAVAGLNAQSKGRRLGIFATPEPGAKATAKPAERAAASVDTVPLLGRAVPIVRTRAGVRAATAGRADDPAAVQRYLAGKFGAALDAAREALRELARAVPKRELDARAFELYEAFRPGVPEGQRGWGAKGVLDLARVRALAGRARGE